MISYLSDLYNLEDINVASTFDELSFWSAQFGILLFNNLTIERNIKILDLACGNGFPLFESAGFIINRTTEDKFIIRYSNANALFNHSLVKVGFLGGWKSIVKDEHMEEIFSQLEKELDKIVIKFSELKMSIPMLYLEAKKLEK